MAGIEREDFCRRLKEQIVLPLDKQAVDQFYRYYCELIRVNEYMNLTAITDPDEVIRKHFLDSLLPLSFSLIQENVRCVDVGSGAGFPGIPIAILRPDLQITLLDSLGKRVDFLSSVCRMLGLSNCRAVKIRAEEAAGADREGFSYAFSRGVAKLSVLAEYCLPLLKEGGSLLAWKSLSAKEEAREAENAFRILGGEIGGIFGTEERNIVLVRKNCPTPPQYPRRAGIPEKRPL